MYQALYRKYRPQNFDDVVGQNVVIKTLKNSIINNKISHAYMFFGPRGTGKTTISKIFARSINCLEPIDGNSCGKCENCLHSYEKECVDIIEMDAASNNGVDEIRELRNKISLVPAELKYKVYIIDEVHMLSIGAFNALLKTLEEPPSHAVFILATTDPQKVPETIVSRCQCFSFERISENMIFELLKSICIKEKVDVDEEVLKDISIVSEGGLRDALGLLDKLISYTNGKITYDDYVEIHGLVSKLDIISLTNSVLTNDIAAVLSKLNDIYDSGKNVIQVITRLMYYIREELVNCYLKSKNIDFDIKLATNLINMINEKMFDIKRSDNPKIYIEILLLKFMGNNVADIENISREIKKDENISQKTDEITTFQNNVSESVDTKEKNIPIIEENKNISNKSNIKEVMNIRVNNTFAMADKNVLKEEIKKLELLNDFTFDQKIGYLVCEILNSKFRVASTDNIVISYEYESIVEQNLLHLDNLIDVYNKITNSNKNFAIISDDDWERYKNEYITSIKSGSKYVIKDEPNIIFEEKENNDIIKSSAIELFGDIVEVE